MFKKTIFAVTFVLFGLIAGWLFLTLHISDYDRQKFHQLQLKGREIASTSSPTSTQQNRAHVRKDLWISQGDGTRLHDRILSTSSTLTLAPVEDHLDIVEHLNQIECSMQDKVVMENGKILQQVRHFNALSGIYQYSTSRFTAETVSLALFRLPGRELPASLSKDHPYLKGVARDVSFAVAGKASQFQAKHFKASFVGQKVEHK